jgi:hypothetical protein
MPNKANAPQKKELEKKKARGKKKRIDEKNQDVVMTPAGPVPKDKVHPVKPGEVVRRNEDGTYTVVPKG